MRNKNIISSTIITIIIGSIILLSGFVEKPYRNANTVYQVYLDGRKLGLIADEKELYDLINEEQSEIREKFGVDKVYPPNGFTISKFVTYKESVTSAEEIYDQIKNKKPFTIKGYEITIEDKEDNNNIKQIYVLQEELVEEALRKVVTAFVNETNFEAYSNKTQPEIVDVGSKIENMYFDNFINGKEANIATDNYIYTDVDELTRYLLFGINTAVETYTVKAGDSIESIAYNHKLNAQEFLIANTQFTSEKNLLAVGEEVTIALINPVVTFVYDVYAIEDTEVTYKTTYIDDPTKPNGYRHVEPGQKGITRIAKKVQFVNGEESQEGYIDTVNSTVIREPVDEVITRGRKVISTTPVVTTGAWAWPTRHPYIISSYYGWRGGAFHDALDISGTGWGSPIYAAQGGVVIFAGPSGMAYGINIYIDHQNGYFTQYSHLSSVRVRAGEVVKQGQQIGAMGNTGSVSPRPTAAYPTRGTHLHFAVYKGEIRSGNSINPLSLYN